MSYLEVTNIDYIKSYKSGVETHISLSNSITSKISLLGKNFFYLFIITAIFAKPIVNYLLCQEQQILHELLYHKLLVMLKIQLYTLHY